MKAQYQKTLYDHIASRPHLDIVVVKEVHKLLNGEKKDDIQDSRWRTLRAR